MGFSQRQAPTGVTVVRVDGQLIIGNRQELKDLIQAAVDRGERRILVDFSDTGYIDSSGPRGPGRDVQTGSRTRRRAQALRA